MKLQPVPTRIAAVLKSFEGCVEAVMYEAECGGHSSYTTAVAQLVVARAKLHRTINNALKRVGRVNAPT